MNARTLQRVIEDARTEAKVLRRNGHDAQATALELVLFDIEKAAAPFLKTLSEKEAELKSNHATEWLRARFGEWEQEGFAFWNGRARLYLDCVIPRADITTARAGSRKVAV